MDEIVDLLEAGVPPALILERAGTNCLAFEVDAAAGLALRRVGATDAFVEALGSVCSDAVGPVPGDPSTPGPDAGPDPAAAPLPSGVSEAVADRLVRVSYLQDGRFVCTNGYVASNDGFVLTTMGALPDTGPFRVTDVSGLDVFGEASVARTDPELGLVVLRVTDVPADPLTRAPAGVSGAVWSVHTTGCGTGLIASASRLDPDFMSNVGPSTLAIPLPGDAIGAPLIDAEGALLGIVTGPSTMLSGSVTEGLLARARMLALQVEPDRGGFPWAWVGAGAVAAVAGALLASRGQDGPGTGTITIPLP